MSDMRFSDKKFNFRPFNQKTLLILMSGSSPTPLPPNEAFLSQVNNDLILQVNGFSIIVLE